MTTELNTPECNRLIAEFMGGEYLHDFDPTFITFKRIQFGGMWGDYSCHLTKLYFHSSWEWLMPVCEKIELLNYGTKSEYHPNLGHVFSIYDRINNKDIRGNVHLSKIEAVYSTIVRFIERFNTQNKNN